VCVCASRLSARPVEPKILERVFVSDRVDPVRCRRKLAAVKLGGRLTVKVR